MHMAGAKSGRRGMTVNELIKLIRTAGRIPVQRDSLYRTIQIYDKNTEIEELDIYESPRLEAGDLELLPTIQ